MRSTGALFQLTNEEFDQLYPVIAQLGFSWKGKFRSNSLKSGLWTADKKKCVGEWRDGVYWLDLSVAAELLIFFMKDNQRLREGKFTEEEFQNLCHAFSPEDQERFKTGCKEYWKKLFGNGNTQEEPHE